jgi:flagellar hook-associated protein 1
MSPVGSAMNSALQSLLASQLGLSVASNNISNANTPGYSRQRLNVVPSDESGVQVLGVEALRDQLTTSRFNQQTSARSEQDMLQQGLQDIQSSFNDTQGTGLLSVITGFFNSFQTLSTNPTSMTNRETVKQAAVSLTNAFHAQAANLSSRQQYANQAVATDVDKINTLTNQISNLTKEIQTEEVSGQPENQLRDQRSELVRQLSEVVNVNELESNGNYELTLGNGRMLVFNGDSQNISVAAGANGLYKVQAGSQDITGEIGGGDLHAQLELRDQKIPSYISQLDQLAYEITQHVNTIHSAAYTLGGTTGVNFFDPLSSAAGSASGIAVNSTITSNTQNIAASQNGTDGDNSAAIAIGNLFSSPVFSGGSVTDQYGSLVFNIGNDVSNAKANFQEADALVTQLQNRIQSLSGVSIDEEAAQILQFQRAFQASSKVISAVDQMLQTTLAMVTTSA